MPEVVDHQARRGLLVALSTNRKATRAARDYYDAVLSHHGTGTADIVAQAGRTVYARLDAGAIDERTAAKQLAALLSAWRAVR